jgi:hypothetical protein
MFVMLLTVLRSFRVYFQGRADLQAEIFALRHQIVVLQRQTPKAELETRRSTLLGLPIPILVPMAFSAVDRETRYCVDWHRRGFLGTGPGRFNMDARGGHAFRMKHEN